VVLLHTYNRIVLTEAVGACTVCGEYYSNLLTGLDEKIREKKTRFAKEKKSSFIRTKHPLTKVFWQWEN
jgi:hypothetical protein